MNYMIQFTDSDMRHIVTHVKKDTSHHWEETDQGYYVLKVYPSNPKDTIFGFRLITFSSMMDMSINQGF